MTHGPEDTPQPTRPDFGEVMKWLQTGVEQHNLDPGFAMSLGRVMLEGATADHDITLRGQPAAPVEQPAPGPAPEPTPAPAPEAAAESAPPKSEAEAAPEKKLFDALMKESPVSIYLYGKDGVMSQFNETAVKVYDWQEADRQRAGWLAGFGANPYVEKLSRQTPEVVSIDFARNDQKQGIHYKNYIGNPEHPQGDEFAAIVHYRMADKKGNPLVGVQVVTPLSVAQKFGSTIVKDAAVARDMVSSLWNEERVNPDMEFEDDDTSRELTNDEAEARTRQRLERDEAAEKRMDEARKMQDRLDKSVSEMLIIDRTVMNDGGKLEPFVGKVTVLPTSKSE